MFGFEGAFGGGGMRLMKMDLCVMPILGDRSRFIGRCRSMKISAGKQFFGLFPWMMCACPNLSASRWCAVWPCLGRAAKRCQQV